MNAKRCRGLCFLCAFALSGILYGQSNRFVSKKTWLVKSPFEHKVFIENKGQITEEEKLAIGEPILYYSRKGKLQLYLTKHSLVFRYDSLYKAEDGKKKEIKQEKDEDDDNIRVKPVYSKITWEGANAESWIEAENETNDYFTYPNPDDKTGHSGIKANAWEKLIYHNLYDGIDVEFFYPAKGGIEYTIIIHPGADISKISMHYPDNSYLKLVDNNIYHHSICVDFTHHYPQGKLENGKLVNVSYILKKNTVSFSTHDYYKSNTLIIDSWITSTSFDTLNHAYDVNCDKYGNVYIYGGYHPYELQQYNSTGTLMWTYTALFGSYANSLFYGSFTVDSRSGTSYIAEGVNSDGCNLKKINSNGLQTAAFTTHNKVQEIWRVGFDYCNNIIVTGNGTPFLPSDTLQASVLDTELTALNPVNILHTHVNYRDVAIFALDQAGSGYFGFSSTGSSYSASETNLLKIPLPSLLPTTFNVLDYYHFLELTTQKYYPYYGNEFSSNGFNGIAANKNLLLTYDGSALEKRETTNGIIFDSIIVSDSSFLWGGLDIDCGDNIYVGKQDSIIVYDTNFVRHAAISLPDTMVNLTIQSPHDSLCMGEQDSILVTGAINYTWSPTTGLSCTTCANPVATPTATTTYTVIGFDSSGCADTTTVTVKVRALPIATITPPQKICKGDSVILTASGGGTYLWSNDSIDSTIVVYPTSTSTYSVIIKKGCSVTASTSVTILVPLLFVCCDTAILPGNSVVVFADSSSKYVWFPSTGLNCDTCSLVVANPTVTTTYTVTGTDSAGCETEKIITIMVENSCENFIVPNVFTPNGDGINDYFEIRIENPITYSIIIYDRWGKEIYKSTNPKQYWNGNTESGIQVPDGEYYYNITTTCQNTTYNKQGFVEVIR